VAQKEHSDSVKYMVVSLAEFMEARACCHCPAVFADETASMQWHPCILSGLVGGG